jgi:hypothetical protein
MIRIVDSMCYNFVRAIRRSAITAATEAVFETHVWRSIEEIVGKFRHEGGGLWQLI